MEGVIDMKLVLAKPVSEAIAAEAALIARAQQGDPVAIETLFARHSPALYRTALRLLGNEAEAEDAVQDGLLSAFRNLRRFEGRSQFSSWLTRIVINAALMRLRRHRARPTVSIDGEQPENELQLADLLEHPGAAPDELVAGGQLREILAGSVEELTPALRKAFLLRYAGGLSNEEAARKLGISVLALKTRVHRARTVLADKMRGVLSSLRAFQPQPAPAD